jgi:MFS family permease
MRRPHRRLYVACFANDFVFAYAFYAAMFAIRGLDTFTISALLAFWAFSAAILEIPTGALADTLGRKRVVAIAPLVKSLCFVAWAFAGGDALLYGLGFLFWGFSEALHSGSFEALLYDSLKARGEEDTYEKIVGRTSTLAQTASGAGMIVGGLLTPLGLEVVCLLSVPSILVASVAVWTLDEPPRREAEGSPFRRYVEYLRIARREIVGNPTLRFLVLAGLGVGTLGTLEEYDQLFFREAGVPLLWIGVLAGTFFGSRSVAALLAHRLKGRAWPIPLVTMAAGALLIASALRLSLPAILPLLLAYMAGAIGRVLLDGRFQAAVASTARATVTSVASMFYCTFTIGEMLLLGWLSRRFGIPGIYAAGGGFALLMGLWILARQRRYPDRS